MYLFQTHIKFPSPIPHLPSNPPLIPPSYSPVNSTLSSSRLPLHRSLGPLLEQNMFPAARTANRIALGQSDARITFRAAVRYTPLFLVIRGVDVRWVRSGHICGGVLRDRSGCHQPLDTNSLLVRAQPVLTLIFLPVAGHAVGAG